MSERKRERDEETDGQFIARGDDCLEKGGCGKCMGTPLSKSMESHIIQRLGTMSPIGMKRKV